MSCGEKVKRDFKGEPFFYCKLIIRYFFWNFFYKYLIQNLSELFFKNEKVYRIGYRIYYTWTIFTNIDRLTKTFSRLKLLYNSAISSKHYHHKPISIIYTKLNN